MAITLDLSTGFDWISDTYMDITVFSIDWIISLVIIMVILLLISRNPNDWKILAFPVSVIVHIMGFTPSLLWYMLTVLFFASEVFSINQLSGLLKVFEKKKRPDADLMQNIGELGKKGYERLKKEAKKINKDKRSSPPWK